MGGNILGCDIKGARCIVGASQVKGGGEGVLVHVAGISSHHEHFGAVCRERDIIGGSVLRRDVEGARCIVGASQVKRGVKLVLVHVVVLASHHEHLGSVCRERDALGDIILRRDVEGARCIGGASQVKGGGEGVLVHAVRGGSHHEHFGAVCRERDALRDIILRPDVKGARCIGGGYVKRGGKGVLVHAT